jgi:hypothetical protein
MQSVRFAKTYYIAAFVLGALVALLVAAPAHSAETFRLDRVAIVQFTAGDDGKLLRHQGVLHHDGRVFAGATFEVVRPANTPAWALDRNLIRVEAWQSYYALGSGALANFTLLEGGVRAYFGDEAFLHVAPDPEATPAGGRMINLSTRARITTIGEPAVAGFVIEGQPRIVLVRAIGPSLARFGLSAPAPDPFLSVKRNGQTIYFNDNWSAAGESEAIRDAAARTGAFPLDPGSRDAARLVLLAPGAYTVEVEPAGPDISGGEVLLEIYSVPDDALEIFGDHQ